MAHLCSLTRSKLHRDSGCSLHRWVLLKNSILNSPSPAPPSPLPDTTPSYPHDDSEDDDDADEVLGSTDVDSFMFPDAGGWISATPDVQKLEAQWLDSLLETLGDDDDDDDYSTDSDSHISTLPVDDDEFSLCSPMSSSDDLIHQPTYYSSSISVPYTVPYPPHHHAYHFDSTFETPAPSLQAPYEVPLPYHDLDDLEDPVPDTIEDTSDDESDAPTTPSLGRSSSSLSLIDAASIPLPPDRSGLRHAHPRVFDDSFFQPFEIDPLPFPDEQLTGSYNHYQEC